MVDIRFRRSRAPFFKQRLVGVLRILAIDFFNSPNPLIIQIFLENYRIFFEPCDNALAIADLGPLRHFTVSKYTAPLSVCATA